MTNTAHERALELAEKAYNNEVDYLGDSAMLRYCNDVPLAYACCAYLQALLDDAETVNELAAEIYDKRVKCGTDAPAWGRLDKTHKEVYRGYVYAMLATLKRMGSV